MTQELFDKASKIQRLIHILECRISSIEQMMESGYDSTITSVNKNFIPIGLSDAERKEVGEMLIESARASLEAYKQMFNNL
jgi:hypothetical protein